MFVSYLFTGIDLGNIHASPFSFEDIEKWVNSIWSLDTLEKEQANDTSLEWLAWKTSPSTVSKEERTIYEVGEGTRKLLTNPQSQIQRLVHEILQVYPVNISKFTQTTIEGDSKYSVYHVSGLNQLYRNSWSVFHHLKMLKCQHMRGRMKSIEDWSRCNWRGWMEWLRFARNIRKDSCCIHQIPKDLALKSLFIHYVDQYLLIYVPFRSIQYSIPLHRPVKYNETESAPSKQSVPLPLEVVQLLKSFMLDEDANDTRKAPFFPFQNYLWRKKMPKSSPARTMDIFSCSVLHSLFFENQRDKCQLLSSETSFVMVSINSTVALSLIGCVV